MRTRDAWFFALVITALAAVGAAAQKWTPPKTSDGQPDLQGIWTNGTATPLERPSEFAGKEYLTKEEAAEWEKKTAVARNSDRRRDTPKEDLQWAYNNTWYDWGSKIIKTGRSSINH